jgi:hypothetical protein
MDNLIKKVTWTILSVFLIFGISAYTSGKIGNADKQINQAGEQVATMDKTNTMQQKWTKESVKKHVENWKDTPKDAANKMIDKYGIPEEVTDHRLVWHNKGDFARTMVTNEEIDHDFPMPHKDCLLQSVNYEIPVEKFSDIAEYDGSVITERTKGTMAARCDKEPMNYLALNLAHDVAQGKRSVEDARSFYAETAVAFMKGEKPEYTQKLVFSTNTQAGDSDQPKIDESVMKEIMDMEKN